MLSPSELHSTSLKNDFTSWATHVAPVYISSLDDLEADNIVTLIIDEVDLTLCRSPSKLKDLLRANVEIVGFSASLDFDPEGEALHFMN